MSSTQRNPFRRVQYIPPVDEILNYAFEKSAKAKSKYARSRRKSREEKIVTLEEARIATLSSELTSRLDKITDQFPWVDHIHPFYISLCSLFADIEEIKRILGRIKGISAQIKKIEQEEIKKLKKTLHPQEAAKIRKAAGGRFASLAKKARSDIKYLIRIVKKAKAIPDFDVTVPTVVVAGGPNVGKSSLVRLISTGKPEIGAYPFTTKKIVFGHRDLFFTTVQIVDTPGMLDRPFEERNIIELQSIASIRYIADIIVYMFDFTKDATLKPEEQISLLNDIKEEFKEVPIIRVLNKIDLLSEKELEQASKLFKPDFVLSAQEKKNTEPFIERLEKEILKLWRTNEKFKGASEIVIDEEYLPEEEEEDIEYNL
ncbi:MAG: NOG1 family protein [Candidatus Heimdallarchaeaceae archaeon]